MAASLVRNTGNRSDDAVMIFVYIVAGLVGIWGLYTLWKFWLQTQQYVSRKRKLHAEMKFIRMSMLNEPSRVPRPSAPEYRQQGAYIDGPVVGVNRDIVSAQASSMSDKAGSEKSSSVVISSLHSSEMSDISYSVYSDDIFGEDESVYSDDSKSSRLDLEVGDMQRSSNDESNELTVDGDKSESESISRGTGSIV